MSDFETFVSLELPRRPVMLTVDLTGYDGDPNAGGAPAIISGAPKGSLYLRDSTTRLYQKTTAAAGTYVDLVSNDEYQSAITLAVSTTGNDSDPTRPARIVGGDWTTKPFATIQAALAALPKLLRGVLTPAVINVAAGTYAGFLTRGVTIPVKLQGVRQAATLATGPNTGTATGGSGSTLILTGAGWTLDNLVGRYLSIVSGPGAGQIPAIAKNTTDTITLAGNASPGFGVGSVFAIEDSAVIINGPTPGSSYPCFLTDFTNTFTITDIVVNASSSIHYVYASAAGVASFVRCRSNSAPFAGFLISNGSALAFLADCVAKTPGSAGFYCQGCQSVVATGNLAFGGNFGYLYYLGIEILIAAAANTARSCVVGFRAEGAPRLSCSDLKILDCGTAVVLVGSVLRVSGLFIDNCYVTTTQMNTSTLHVLNAFAGSGNVGFGVNAKGAGNLVFLEGLTPTITGSSGDATVDGATPLVWAAAFGVPDTYAVDTTSGARIYRS